MAPGTRCGQSAQSPRGGTIRTMKPDKPTQDYRKARGGVPRWSVVWIVGLTIILVLIAVFLPKVLAK